MFFFFTNLVKMLLSCAIALYCSSPGDAKGDLGWWPWIALASALAARVASSKGDANGAAQLCGKNLLFWLFFLRECGGCIIYDTSSG